MLFTGNGSVKFFVNLPVACINAAVADHFEMLFRDMADEVLYEIHNGKSLLNIGIIFVAVVMEGDKAAIIFVNPGCGDNGTPEITANIFDGCFWVAFVGLRIYVETFLMLPVTAGLDFFKGRVAAVYHLIGIFHLSLSGMKGIFNFLIMVNKDFL